MQSFTHVISWSLLTRHKQVTNLRISVVGNFFVQLLCFAPPLKTLRSLHVQNDFFLTDLRSQNGFVKKIVVGSGLQLKMLFQEKNPDLPVPWENELYRLVSLFGFFCLTTLFFFQSKDLPDIQWAKRKWLVLGRAQEMRGLRQKCQFYPKCVEKIPNKAGFAEYSVPVFFHQSKGILGSA